MARVIGVVLAAGAGTRMGRPKAEVTVDGVRLVDRARSVLAGGGCAEVVVVVRRGVALGDAHVVVNDDPDRGMRSSLELGVEAAAHLAADAVAVVLVDTPGITAAGVRAVLAAWRPGRVTVAAYDGRRGHPTVMAPASWRRAVGLAGPDEGARAMLRLEFAAVDEVDVDGDPTDLDTAEDVARWNAGHGQP